MPVDRDEQFDAGQSPLADATAGHDRRTIGDWAEAGLHREQDAHKMRIHSKGLIWRIRLFGVLGRPASSRR